MLHIVLRKTQHERNLQTNKQTYKPGIINKYHNVQHKINNGDSDTNHFVERLIFPCLSTIKQSNKCCVTAVADINNKC